MEGKHCEGNTRKVPFLQKNRLLDHMMEFGTITDVKVVDLSRKKLVHINQRHEI